MAAGKPALFLLDGNSLLYRSYYAIRGLASPTGFPTNAIYGFLLTLRKLVAEEQPGYLGVVFDLKGPTVRHKLDDRYKAGRKPMPDDLQLQVPVLKDVLRAHNIPLFEYPEYEADDILGTLVKKASARGLPSVIVSTDKDLLQLVNDDVRVYNPSKEILLDAAAVEEALGVKPGQVVDLLSLSGDASDNVAGVRGVGEKTAKDLLRDFGSLENLLNNIHRVKNPRLQKILTQGKEAAEHSRKLVTIETGLDIALDPEALRLGPPDGEQLASLFRELGFSSFLEDAGAGLEEIDLDVRLILEEDALRGLVREVGKRGFVSVDTETDGYQPTRARLVGMSFCFEPGTAFYLPLGHKTPDSPPQLPKEKALGLLRGVLGDPAVKKI
ncbi:MAG: DNA polymerase I, partial [Candidatus Aminicenantes bacterium]|nr:DNA polymerase I [Candidatus Aminicenantes bacterium]